MVISRKQIRERLRSQTFTKREVGRAAVSVSISRRDSFRRGAGGKTTLRVHCRETDARGVWRASAGGGQHYILVPNTPLLAV